MCFWTVFYSYAGLIWSFGISRKEKEKQGVKKRLMDLFIVGPNGRQSGFIIFISMGSMEKRRTLG